MIKMFRFFIVGCLLVTVLGLPVFAGKTGEESSGSLDDRSEVLTGEHEDADCAAATSAAAKVGAREEGSSTGSTSKSGRASSAQ
jgi:hypothetical protein